MKAYETYLFHFLLSSQNLEKYTRKVKEIGEDPVWYLEHLGNEPYAILMTFDGWVSDYDEMLDWVIVQESFLFYLEEWHFVKAENIYPIEWAG